MGFEKLTNQGRSRATTVAGGILLAWACTVVDKGDYTFTDEPAAGGDSGEGGADTGGSSSGGRGGSSGSSTTGGRGGRGGTSSSGGGEGGEVTGGAAGAGGAGPCDPNPCVHGDCSVDGDTYDCSCEAGWQGSRCQTNIDDCDPNPCLNGGTCTDGVDEFSCECTTGYSGPTCEEEPADCDPNPCVNGTCNEVTGGITCTCQPGWEGENCSTNIDECASRPCANGGTCTDRVNAFVCACPPAWTGPTCTMDVNECTTTPCRNGGTCTNTDGGFTCACPTGWEQPTCSSGTITLGFYDAGFWDETNGHQPANMYTYFGQAYYTTDYNAFFVWSIPTFEGTVTGARVELLQDGYWSNDAFETVSLYGYTGSIPALITGGVPNPTIFNDLQNAPLYAQLNAPRTSMILHSITLSSTAFGPIGSARGNLFAFGLHVETITGSSYEEALRFGGPPGNANRLFITVSP